MIARLGSRIRRDRRGATIIEFAIVAPVLCLSIMGLCDLLYQVYAQALLDGAIQKSGRDSAIQGGADQAAALDARVRNTVRQIAPNATYVSSRKTYSTFTQMKPERFSDANGNNVYDSGECYEDINGNGQWDADPSRTGQGGASDATMYTVTVTYPHLFPVEGLLGWSANQTLVARTLLKNQPYTKQIAGSAPTPCS